MKQSKFLITAGVLFAAFFFIGIFLSQRKPMWNDELYTQRESVEKLSYWEILSGRLSEGNNLPLFYLIQKAVCDGTGYRLGGQWRGEWQLSEPRGQIILRISSNFFMSLGLATIFYYFAGQFFIGAGVYALLLALSSPMVWGYWAEARPYSLWIMLTVLQSLALISLVAEKKDAPGLWNRLGCIHLLLSFTVALSIMQIVIAALLAGILKKKYRAAFVWCTLASVLVCFFYYIQSPRFQFFFAGGPILKLIADNLSPGQVLIFIGYAVFLWYSHRESNRADWDLSRETGKMYLAFILMMGLATASLMLYLRTGDTAGKTGFEISSRYFIYLTPVGIIGTALFAAHLLEFYRVHKWLLINLAVVLIGFVIQRFLNLLITLQG